MKRKWIRRGLFGILLCIGCIQINNSTKVFNDLQANGTQEKVILSSNALMDIASLDELESEDVGIAPLSLDGHKLQDPTTLFNPVVFVEFQDDTGEWITQETLQKAENLYNESASSVAKYFNQVSFGKLQVVSCFFPNEKTAQGYNLRSIKPFRSSYPRGYIEPKSASNPIGYDPTVGEDDTNPDSYRYHEAKIIEEIVGLDNSNVVKQLTQNITVVANHYGITVNNRYSANGFDWTFPEASKIKTLEQRSADSFTFVFRGSVGSPQENPILWPHKYAYPNSVPIFDRAIASLEKVNGTNAPVYLDNYVIVPGDSDITDPTKMNLFNSKPNYGVVIHEFLHQFYAPELYRMNYQGQAVGKWDVMGEQTEEPQALLQYTNQKFGIWDTPDVKEISKTTSLNERSYVTVDVPTYEDDTNYTAVKIVPEDTSKKEYFMVEYRKKSESGIDSELPNSGLLVYRVREDMPSTNHQGAFCGITCGNMLTGLQGESTADEVFVFRPNAANATLLDQHYIDPQLENAPFPRVINGSKINKIGKSLTEVPASSSPSDFDPDTLYFSDGSNSGIRIENISDPTGNTMSFSVLYGEEGAVEVIKTIEATQTDVKQRGSVIDPNTIRITGGTAPYSFTISSVKKDDDLFNNHPFTLDHVNANDTNASLQASAPLASGTYEIEIVVQDTNTFTKTITVTYQILPEFPDASKISYTNENVEESNVQADTKVGELGIDGCTKGLDGDYDAACYTKYQYTYEVYELGFLAGKDYSSYFYIDEFNGRYVGDISAKGSVPAGTYECIAKINFIDLNDNGDEIILDTIQKNITIEIKPDGGSAVTPPTISQPSGTVLTTSSWMKGMQEVEITLVDTQGLASLSVVTSDGAFFIDNQEATSFEKTYTGTILTDTLQLPIYKNGTYTITITNTSGASASKSFTVSKLDTTLPAVAITTNQREVSITASDSTSSIAQLFYVKTTSADAEDTLTYDQVYTAPFTIENEFAGRVCAKAIDDAGNQATTCTTIQAASGTTDTIDPVIAQPTFTPNSWTNQTLVMSVLISDDVEAVSLTVSTSDGELLVQGEKKTSYTYSFAPSASHTQNVEIAKNGNFTLVANDSSGNTSTSEIEVHWIDQAAPVVSVQAIYDALSDRTDITLSAIDQPAVQKDQSGIDSLQYQYLPAGQVKTDLIEGNWMTYTSMLAYPNASADQGLMCARASDHAGNTSEVVCKPLHGADNQAPTINNTIQGLVDIDTDPTGWTNAVSIPLSFTVSDAQSGIQSVTLKKGNVIMGTPYTASSSSPVSSYTYTTDVSENGSYTLYVEDAQGNIETHTFSVNQFDHDAPVIDKVELVAKRIFLVFPTREQRVSIQAHDLPLQKHSGIKEYRYTIGTLTTSEKQNDSNWKTISAQDTIEIKQEEKGTLYIYAYDHAGNRSALFEEAIEREPSYVQPYLKSLTLSTGTLSPSFSKTIFSYQVKVDPMIDEITLQAQAEDASMQVEGDNQRAIAIPYGETTLHVTVGNATQKQVYEIKVIREKPVAISAELASLQPSMGSLSPAFDSKTLSYTIEVAHGIDTIQLTAVAASKSAQIHGDANTNIPLSEGDTTLSILVQDGLQSDGSYQLEQTYTIKVHRAGSILDKDASLSSLKPSSGSLTPQFSPMIYEYSVTLPYATTSIQLLANASSAKAVVRGNGNKSVELKVGMQTLRIVCEAEDGTQKEYKVHVTREAEPKDKEPSVEPSYELYDTTTAIKVIGSFDEHYALVSEKIEEAKLSEEAKSSYTLMEAFDIYIKKDGERYSINEEVKVRIPRKPEWDDTMDLVVVYIDEDGTLTQMPTIVTKEYLEFTTNHFSTYAIVQKQSESLQPGAQTGDSNSLSSYLFLLLCSGIGMVCLYARRCRN